VQAIYQDPVAAGLICAKAYDLAPDIAKVAVANMIAPRMWSEGAFVQAELDRMIGALELIGQVKGAPDWGALIDKRYLPADLQG
jgi:NitT/TauT family transport system substrate-binding protein